MIKSFAPPCICVQVLPFSHVQGSAVGQDGRSSSLTAPNGPSQQALVAAVLLRADLTAAQVALVAIHGTGTPLGDPIGETLTDLCARYLTCVRRDSL